MFDIVSIDVSQTVHVCLIYVESPFCEISINLKNQNKFIWPNKDENRPNPRTMTPEKKKKKKKNLFPLVTLAVAGETICFVVGNRGLSSGAQLGWKLSEKGPD